MKNLMLGGKNIILGSGAIEYVKNLAAQKAFIVTGGKSMIASGVVARLENLLGEADCKTLVYSGIKKNPDPGDGLGGLSKMRDYQPDLLVAVGGGSAMDAAKVIAEQMADILSCMFYGEDLAVKLGRI